MDEKDITEKFNKLDISETKNNENNEEEEYIPECSICGDELNKEEVMELKCGINITKNV